MLTLRRLGFITAILVLTLLPSAFGQAVNGTLLGTVNDQSGATVANAKVTAVETQTGLIHDMDERGLEDREVAGSCQAAFLLPNKCPNTFDGLA